MRVFVSVAVHRHVEPIQHTFGRAESQPPCQLLAHRDLGMNLLTIL